MVEDSFFLTKYATISDRKARVKVRRHNYVMEQPVKMQTKTLELEYTMKLFHGFNEMKKEGLGVDKIIEIVPDMKRFL